jgi:hypothetical protein
MYIEVVTSSCDYFVTVEARTAELIKCLHEPALALATDAAKLARRASRGPNANLSYAKIPYDFKLGPIRDANHPLTLYLCIVV